MMVFTIGAVILCEAESSWKAFSMNFGMPSPPSWVSKANVSFSRSVKDVLPVTVGKSRCQTAFSMAVEDRSDVRNGMNQVRIFTHEVMSESRLSRVCSLSWLL